MKLTRETSGRTVTRTIAAVDGGQGSTSVVVRIDRTGPTIRVVGRKLRCVATDALSGVASCHVTRHRHAGHVRYRAVALDVAGNRTVVRGRR